MNMPGRGWKGQKHRFGFQNQEEDKEFWGGAVSYKYRIHDPRVGRFFSVDPLAPEYPWNSPYAFSENRVIDAVELEGLESVRYLVKPEHKQAFDLALKVATATATAAEVNEALTSQTDFDLYVISQPIERGFGVTTFTRGRTNKLLNTWDMLETLPDGTQVATHNSWGLHLFPEAWTEVARKIFHDEKDIALIKIERQLFNQMNDAINSSDVELLEELAIGVAFTAVHEGWVHARRLFNKTDETPEVEHSLFYGIYADNPQKYLEVYGSTSPTIDKVEKLNPNSIASKALREVRNEVKKIRPELEKLVMENQEKDDE